MRSVRVSFMGDLTSLIGQRNVAAMVPEEATVGDLLQALSDTYGDKFTQRVFQTPDKLQHTILIFVEGEEINQSAGLATPLADGEVEVIMLPMLGGGEPWK